MQISEAVNATVYVCALCNNVQVTPTVNMQHDGAKGKMPVTDTILFVDEEE
jgi:hypothetical protein